MQRCARVCVCVLQVLCVLCCRFSVLHRVKDDMERSGKNDRRKQWRERARARVCVCVCFCAKGSCDMWLGKSKSDRREH